VSQLIPHRIFQGEFFTQENFSRIITTAFRKLMCRPCCNVLSHRLLPPSSCSVLSLSRFLVLLHCHNVLSHFRPPALSSLTMLSCAKRLYIFHSTGKKYIPFISVLTSRLALCHGHCWANSKKYIRYWINSSLQVTVGVSLFSATVVCCHCIESHWILVLRQCLE
jgi:hypothetical protein